MCCLYSNHRSDETILISRLFRLQVISWFRGDGEDTLNKFTEVPLECEAVIKDHEQEFEKFYFISMVSVVA